MEPETRAARRSGRWENTVIWGRIMKITPLVAAASIAAAAAFPAPATAQHTVVTVVGAPVGPGWVAYHDHMSRDDWDGPRYWDHPANIVAGMRGTTVITRIAAIA